MRRAADADGGRRPVVFGAVTAYNPANPPYIAPGHRPQDETGDSVIDYTAARQNMVLSQLEPNRVTDPAVTAAMGSVPRERFVPAALAGVAYIDEDIEVAAGRFLMEPMVLGRLLQEARVQARDVVLDIGGGTGYSAAVLARLAASVVALEDDPDLARRAAQALAALGIDAAVVTGPLAAGRPDQAPFDVILLNGAVPSVPSALLDQLADGGRLMAVVGQAPACRAMQFVRRGDRTVSRVLFDAATPALPGFAAPRSFVF